MYREVNNQSNYVKAYEGDKDQEDFCMINIQHCLLEMKTFYLLKTLDGNNSY